MLGIEWAESSVGEPSCHRGIAGRPFTSLWRGISPILPITSLLASLPSPRPEREWARCRIALLFVVSYGSWVRFVVSLTGSRGFVLKDGLRIIL